MYMSLSLPKPNATVYHLREKSKTLDLLYKSIKLPLCCGCC